MKQLKNIELLIRLQNSVDLNKKLLEKGEQQNRTIEMLSNNLIRSGKHLEKASKQLSYSNVYITRLQNQANMFGVLCIILAILLILSI